MLSCRQSLVALLAGFGILLFAGVLHAGPVNINTADVATLVRELKGVGQKKAEAIVEYRQKHGPFRSADELALVKGIGPAAVAKNREFILVEVKPVAKPAPEPARQPSTRR